MELDLDVAELPWAVLRLPLERNRTGMDAVRARRSRDSLGA
jgi:hypothetical protein